LITFEGVDGSGKTTQLRLLATFLRERGITVVETREPGGTEISEKIRAILLDASHSAMVPQTELLLYAASRAQHVEEVIRPALARGETVLSDRFFDATTAYQGYGRGFDYDDILRLNEFATGGLKPHLTFVFDLPPETIRERLTGRLDGKDRLESLDLAFHERVRNGYRAIADRYPTRVVAVDASRDIETIQTELRNELQRRGFC
jgi:dTMP kinase